MKSIGKVSSDEGGLKCIDNMNYGLIQCCTIILSLHCYAREFSQISSPHCLFLTHSRFVIANCFLFVETLPFCVYFVSLRATD